MVYARFKRTRKGSGAYGRKRTVARRRGTAGFKKVSRPRFALSGYRKNIEKKYFDKALQGTFVEALVGNTTATRNSGVMYISNTWQDYNFANTSIVPTAASNDFNKGLATGTTARTRIGNKIKPMYYKGSVTVTACTFDVGAPNGNTMNGEADILVTATNRLQYMRTTYRVVIVKDLQVNSTDTSVSWAQVFETNTNQTAGIHSELNVDNMGRFIVLEDKLLSVDANNPQKTHSFHLSGSSVGNVRYNGPTATALTDRGVYVIWSAAGCIRILPVMRF